MGTTPTPYTFTAGDDATSARLNTISDGALYALGQTTSGGSRGPLARLRQTVQQTLTLANTAVALAFDTEDVDYDNGHSTSTNTSRYTAQTAGWHLVSGCVHFTGTTASGVRYIAVYVNGTSLIGATGWAVCPTTGALSVVHEPIPVFLNVADYVELFATSGVAATTTVVSGGFFPRMSVDWMST